MPGSLREKTRQIRQLGAGVPEPYKTEPQGREVWDPRMSAALKGAAFLAETFETVDLAAGFGPEFGFPVSFLSRPGEKASRQFARTSPGWFTNYSARSWSWSKLTRSLISEATLPWQSSPDSRSLSATGPRTAPPAAPLLSPWTDPVHPNHEVTIR